MPPPTPTVPFGGASQTHAFSCILNEPPSPPSITLIPSRKPATSSPTTEMADDGEVAIYDEIEIEDMTFDEAQQMYHYPCPCGDKFQILLEDLRDQEDIAVCPSCSLMIRVIFDLVRTTSSAAS